MVNASMQPKRCRIASSTTQFNWFLDEQKHLQLSDARTYISGLKIYDTGIPELKPPEGG